MPFDHKIFFDSVRDSLFSGSMSQPQVDGMDAILTGWETYVDEKDRRWLAYMFATTFHETSQEMQPIEEYGKGEGQPYGETDPETGETYYGRGFVQCTWRENYARCDSELGLSGDDSCEFHADNMLKLETSARAMYAGMVEGWYRKDDQGPQNLNRYFDADTDDPFGAREIINGDKNTVPSWSHGVSIGKLIEGYHDKFLDALDAARIEEPTPEPVPEPEPATVDINMDVHASEGAIVTITINGERFI